MLTNTDVKKLRVLIIEDNPADFKLTRRLLENVNGQLFEVEWQDRLSSGIDRIRKGGIDVVLLDLSLPDSYWSDTFDRLKSVSAQIPIIVMSGVSHQDLPLEIIRNGAEDYLVKGETDSQLFAHAIRHAIERHKMKRQLNGLNNQMRKDLRQMESLLKLDLMINTTHDLDQLFDIARRHIPIIFHSKSFSIYLYDAEKKSLERMVADPPEKKQREEILEGENDMAWDAFRSGRPVFSGPAGNEDSVCVPLITRDTILGVLTLEGLSPESRTPGSLTNIQRVSNHLSLALYNARLMKKVQEMAIKDDLTGLFNRHYFYQELTREVERVKRHQSPFSVLILDIDEFKKINDSYGHHVGDEALRKTANIIRSHLRPNDVACRLGGDEFIVILPQTRGEDAVLIVDRLRQILAEEVFYKAGGNELKFTVSLGLAEYGGAEDIETLLRRADGALYQAKKLGRNNTVLH